MEKLIKCLELVKVVIGLAVLFWDILNQFLAS